MSTYASTDRTNYFRVQDLDAFKADLENHAIDYRGWNDRVYTGVILDEDDNNKPQGAIALFAEDGWPSFDPDQIADKLELEEFETDYEGIEDLIAAHLVPTDVAVVMGAGAEKQRYVNGYAIAVNSTGQRRQIVLSDIYDLAKEIAPQTGASITLAEY